MTGDLKERLRLNEKWSVVFDPADNDRPLLIERYGEPAGDATGILGFNAGVAMFYAIRERDEKITDLEARLANAEAERDYWQKDSAAAWDKCEERRLQAVAAEAGEDALAEAGRKAVVQLIDHGSDGYASGLDSALAAYEARRKG